MGWLTSFLGSETIHKPLVICDGSAVTNVLSLSSLMAEGTSEHQTVAANELASPQRLRMPPYHWGILLYYFGGTERADGHVAS